MNFNLKQTRENYGFTPKKMAEYVGIKENAYLRYERGNIIPSKYIYVLWTKLKDFPIPEDFFYFTSFTLLVNMKYYKMTQKEVGKLFEIERQSSISKLMEKNIPMYEKKDFFLKFDPLIIPFQIKIGKELSYSDFNKKILKKITLEDFKEEKVCISEVTSLTAYGNFISAQKKKEKRLSKEV